MGISLKGSHPIRANKHGNFAPLGKHVISTGFAFLEAARSLGGHPFSPVKSNRSTELHHAACCFDSGSGSRRCHARIPTA